MFCLNETYMIWKGLRNSYSIKIMYNIQLDFWIVKCFNFSMYFHVYYKILICGPLKKKVQNKNNKSCDLYKILYIFLSV